MASRFRAVMLDMDGLVLDTEPGYVRAWRQAAAEMGFPLSEAFGVALSGCSGAVLVERLREHCGCDFDIQRFSELSGAYWTADVQQNGVAAKPGFFDLLTVLKACDLPYCLVTNSPLHAARQCLSYAGLADTFDLIVTVDSVVRAKPAPDVFLQAASELGYAIQTCLAVEDSSSGVAAAKAAGATCIMVPSLPVVDKETAELADYLMRDLQQVADFISSVESHPL